MAARFDDLPLHWDRVHAAARAGIGKVVRTPIVPSPELSATAGVPLVLKAENLQQTGSFKLRGALAKLSAIGPAAQAGVVLGSAGNHARATAWACHTLGIPCSVFMPTTASITKAEACAQLGAEVRLEWPTVDEAIAAASERARISGQTMLHPFDDLEVVAGQATLGVELSEQVPDVNLVVIPLGGGGLTSGVAWAVKQAHPHARIVAVQAAACSPWLGDGTPGDQAWSDSRGTIADGIAVKRPGAITRQFVDALVDDIVVVEDDAIADAVVWLFSTTKLVVEGAGAVGVAAIQQRLIPMREGPGTTVVILSGGNIDPGVLGDAIRRHETSAGRRLLLRARLDDRPGALAEVTALLAAAGANVVDIQHIREGIDLHFGQTGIEIVAQVRGPDHAARVVEAAQAAGVDIEAQRGWPD